MVVQMTAGTASKSSTAFTIKSLLIPLLPRPRAAQSLKYAVYMALVLNFGIYIHDDWMAYQSALTSDSAWTDVFEQFATTIDTAAWLGLVFLFELETYALPDEAFKRPVKTVLQTVRIICYLGIVYAVYGYTVNTLSYYDFVEVQGLADLCQIADQGRAFQLNAIAYAEVTSENCANLSVSGAYYQAAGEISVIDEATLDQVKMLGWVDVANAIVWLLVVFLIEAEVRMQEADRFDSRSLKAVGLSKTIFYVVLIGHAVIWATTGYPIYAWDAFLWIFGFWAIELNLAEWEQERMQQLAGAQ